MTQISGALQTKVFELRDRATFIPVLAIRIDAAQEFDEAASYLIRRAGYSAMPGGVCILFTRLDGTARGAFIDPYDWGDRTYQVAHEYVSGHWDELPSGSVVDVEYILGEKPAPKISERLTNGV